MAYYQFLDDVPLTWVYTQGFDSFTLKYARPWSEKTYNKLFWRGVTTGGSYRKGVGGPLGWKGGSQRIRAAFTFSNGEWCIIISNTEVTVSS